MWEPTPYDQDPLDPGDGPPAPIWALHAPGIESEPAMPPPAVATPSTVETREANASPADAEPPAEVVSQPPRTVLKRLSQLAAPIKVERSVPVSSGLPPDVDRMEGALAGLERQLTQPRPAAEPPAFQLPSLMDRIRSARLKAAEPAGPALTVPEPPEVPPALLADVALDSPAAPIAPVPEAAPELPATDDGEIDLPLFMAHAGFGGKDENEPPPPQFPAAFGEFPPAPFFTDPLPAAPMEPAAVVAPPPPPEAAAEAAAPAEVAQCIEAEPIVAEPESARSPALSESKAATRHLESLVAVLDSEITSGQTQLSDSKPASGPALPVLPAAEAGRYVVFYLGNTRYGFPIGEVLEMATVPRTTPLPNVPDFIRGVANLRGEVLAVIDLRTLLALEAASDSLRERLLVVRAPQGDAVAGFIVDSVRGLARVGEAAVVQPSMPLNTRAAEFLHGVSSHEDQLLNVLDTRKLFAAPEIVALSAN